MRVRVRVRATVRARVRVRVRCGLANPNPNPDPNPNPNQGGDDSEQLQPGRKGVTHGYMLPVARELHFNQGVDAAAGLVTRLQHQRRGCVRLLAIWEEIVEMQQQATLDLPCISPISPPYLGGDRRDAAAG